MSGDEQNPVSIRESDLPPGAREGQTFHGEDVGLGAGRMNPEAQPVEVRSSQPRYQSMPEGRMQLGGAQVTSVPPVVARGDVHDLRAPQKRGPRWIYEAPGEEPFVIDEGQRQAARESEAREKVARIERAMSTVPEGSHMHILLAKDLAMARAGLGEKDIHQYRQLGQQTGERLGRQEFQAGEAAKTREFQAGQTDKKLASSEKIAAMRKRGVGVGRGSDRAVDADLNATDTAYSRLAPKDQARAKLNARRDLSEYLNRVNWNKLEGTGTDRLAMAEDMLAAKGPNARTQHFEAMMNFFGYIRGGVPAKNETQEWHKLTGDFRTWADSLGGALGLGALGTKYLTGEETEASVRAKLEEKLGNNFQRLSPQLVVEMEHAVRAARKNLQTFAGKALDGAARMFTPATSSPAEMEIANSKLKALGYFAGVGDRDWVTGLTGKSHSQSTPSAPAQGGQQPTKGVSLREALGL